MKAKRTMWQRQTVVAEDPKVKTLDFVLEGNEHGLKEASIRLFDMAKSAGRELNVLFCGEHN